MKYKLYLPQAINEMGSHKNQEDTIYPAPGKATADSRLFLVCDGMGGYERGEVASATVASTISSYLNSHYNPESPLTDELFMAALSAAYDALDRGDREVENKMGTTLTMVCLHHGGVLAAHIGDSRIYHLRPSTGEILYRSRDHSLVHQLYEMGEISYAEMKTSPKKNIVLRAMQPHQEQRVKADLVHITDIKPGDYFYLCTDGMLEQMEDDVLMSILSSKVSDEQKRQQLIAETLANADNHSAYLIHIYGVESEVSDALQPNDEPQARAANKALNDPDRYQTEETDAFDVTMINQDATRQAHHAQAPGTNHSTATTPRRPALKKKSGSKMWLVILIILLVAILTGFTIFNLFSVGNVKKENSVKETETRPTEELDRIEFKKDDAKEESKSNYFPAHQSTSKTNNARNKQTDDEVNNIFEGEKRRQEQRLEQEKAAKDKKEKEEQEEVQRKKEEAQRKAEEAQRKVQDVQQPGQKAQTHQPASQKQGLQKAQPVQATKEVNINALKNATQGQPDAGNKPLEKGKSNE